MPSKPKNRIGEVYGKLKVISLSKRRTSSGNAYWLCQCECGRTREVPSDSLSTRPRKKKNVTECLICARELATEGVCKKNDKQEQVRRNDAIQNRIQLKGKVPDTWLELPLTDAHARELGLKKFFRGTHCLKGHLSPYRINGGCLECAKTTPKYIMKENI